MLIYKINSSNHIILYQELRIHRVWNLEYFWEISYI